MWQPVRILEKSPETVARQMDPHISRGQAQSIALARAEQQIYGSGEAHAVDNVPEKERKERKHEKRADGTGRIPGIHFYI